MAYDNVCVRVCWECRATLSRFQQFKTQIQQSYGELMMHLHQNTPKHTICKQPRLAVHKMAPTNYPELEVKAEHEYELSLMPMDHIKTETVELEHSEDTFVKGFEVEEKKEAKKGTHGISEEMRYKIIQLKEEGVSVTEISNDLGISFLVILTATLLYDADCMYVREGTAAKAGPSHTKPHGFSDREPLGDNVQDVDDNKHDVADNVQGDVSESKAEVNCFICAKCGLLFDDKVAFDGHIQTEHNTQLKVNIEKKDVPIKVTRVKRAEVLTEKPQCTECGKVFSSRKTYRYHLNVLHKGQNRYPCPRCGKVYQWKSNLGRHLRTHKARDDGELYCELCDKRFASVATYRQHLRVSRRHVSESEFSFVCNECGKKFVNKTRLRDHVDWEHLKKIKFKCQLCNKPFKCHTSLYVHMQNVHRNKEKKDNLCHVCGKSYQNAAKLKYHIVAMHTSETPYQCGQCTAAFGWYSSLYRHIREVHYKMKVQPKKSKKAKKSNDGMPIPLAMPQPGPP
ncbi:hypothetical protein MSG28_016055 [Choristoneura fumiferana]|uniref:Uncharacterized protein n=1 Tax=Choristoneura fumiferana TaxID=7141 RepID=A0ACC0K5A4_CHOFU|nr:hypothetical protein MSG28_016055 [Choristoneura fumiferana]